MNKMVGFLYNIGLNCMLKGMNLVNKLYNLLSFVFYRFCGIIDGFFGNLLGLDDYWYFFDGHIYPVHSKNVNLYSKKDATWLYNKRTNVWKPIRGCGKTYFYMPWINSSVFVITDSEKKEGTEVNCTDFIINQKFYRMTNEKRIFPGIEHLFGAWAIQHKAIFTLQEIANATVDVFTLDAEELSIPILSLRENVVYKQSLCGNEDSLDEVDEVDEVNEVEEYESMSDESNESDESDESDALNVPVVADVSTKSEYIMDKETDELIKRPVFDMGIIRTRQDTLIESLKENISEIEGKDKSV